MKKEIGFSFSQRTQKDNYCQKLTDAEYVYVLDTMFNALVLFPSLITCLGKKLIPFYRGEKRNLEKLTCQDCILQ